MADAERHGCIDPENPPGFIVQCSNSPVGFLEISQKSTAALQIGVAAVSQPDSAGRSLEKLGTEHLFESGDLPARRGFGDAKFLRRSGEAAFLSNRHESPYSSKLVHYCCNYRDNILQNKAIVLISATNIYCFHRTRRKR